VTAGIIAAVFLHAADAGATGEHFYDGFDFDIAQTTVFEERRPALVSREQFFERAGTETENHVLHAEKKEGNEVRMTVRQNLPVIIR
jgi:hypothetical protein